MADAQCSCGFCEAGDENIGDHLFQVFAPGDDKGSDGQVHLEGDPPLTCLCGFTGTTAGELDRHFLAVFTPADSVGRDGLRHERVRQPPGSRDS